VKKWAEARRRMEAVLNVTCKKYRLSSKQWSDGAVAGSSKRLPSRFYLLKTCHRLTGQNLEFFFCLIILAIDLYRSWRRTFCPVFLSAVRAVAARCKLPSALRPGLSQEKK